MAQAMTQQVGMGQQGGNGAATWQKNSFAAARLQKASWVAKEQQGGSGEALSKVAMVQQKSKTALKLKLRFCQQIFMKR